MLKMGTTSSIRQGIDKNDEALLFSAPSKLDRKVQCGSRVMDEDKKPVIIITQ